MDIETKAEDATFWSNLDHFCGCAYTPYHRWTSTNIITISIIDVFSVTTAITCSSE
jgi:hypothetical protein